MMDESEKGRRKDMDESGVSSVGKCFSELAHPRIGRGKRHKLTDIVVIPICAVTSGAEGWEATENCGGAKEGPADSRQRC